MTGVGVVGETNIFSLPFQNVYALQARIDVCQSSQSWISVDSPIQLLNTSHSYPSFNLSIHLPAQKNTSIEPTFNISGCVYLSAIMYDQVVFNSSIEVVSTVSQKCQAGTISSTGTNYPEICSLCPLGTYSEFPLGSTTCTDCPENIPRTLNEGAGSLADCIQCPLGSYCPVGSNPILCPKSGGYEPNNTASHLKDRNASDCVVVPCEETYWCGPGAAEGTTYIKCFDFNEISTTAVIKQQKTVNGFFQSLIDTSGITILPIDSTPVVVMNSFSINPLSSVQPPITFETALISGAHYNASLPLLWYRDNPLDNFTFHLPVSIQIVTIIITPTSFSLDMSIQTRALNPPIPTVIQVYNTLCNNSISVRANSTDCYSQPYPDWFYFQDFAVKNSSLLVLPQAGLPLDVSFGLDPTSLIGSSIVAPINVNAPILPLCFNVEAELNGLQISVTQTIQIAYRLLRPVSVEL